MRSLAIIILFFSISAFSQSVDPSQFQELEYRLIGPFRASRTVGAVGIPTQPNVFFMGVNNGGVWKTDDFGRTWNPIFDDAPTGSVGDIAISLSNPEILYVGSGEGLHRPDLGVGDGMFKSIDGGKSWIHVGLPDVQQVARVIIHPTNPDIVFVAGLGHPYGANEERGVFRTMNGGDSWEKVLYIDNKTGAVQVEFDPTNPNIIFADMWQHQEGPWENARFSGPNSGLYKSTDAGETWKKITKGLPTSDDGLGRIGVGIAPSNPKRMYATVDARQKGGIYRSNDAGESWELVATDRRIWSRGSDFAEIRVHPENENVVYSGNIAAYRSDDGGKTWTSFKGAPGGDDYHRLWINPLHPDIMIFAADQGATISVNGGKTWSSWYNQPTTQLYHVTTDNQYPYWVYGGQQESGAIGVASRGNGGQISFRDFMGVGADEYAYIAPDPLNSDIIYGGRVIKFNKKTGQSHNIAPEAFRSGNYRFLRTMPLLFHPADPTLLLFGTNVLWKTTSGGDEWEIISPDLTRKNPKVPASVGDYLTEDMKTMDQRAIIYAVDGSPLDVNIIWAGTDDGLVHLTTDGGKTWANVTPSELKSWDKVSQLDAGHFDKNTAYIAINAIRKDDMRPLIFKTHDSGKTWQKIVNGLHEIGPVNVVREDPKQAGLLFAGTEREVYFSIDDGSNWQSLRMNMPASSIRDLVVKDDDLVIATHGRSAWILDNIAPLRQLAEVDGKSFLFEPPMATRVRYNMFLDTPLPPEEPTGKNPPDGAVLDYHLAEAANFVKIEILDTSDNIVRAYTSSDKPTKIDSTSLWHPTYWIRPEQKVAITPGHHRFIWDLRHAPPAGTQREFAISAVQYDTPDGPLGPFVHPGNYKVRLTVDEAIMEQSLHVRLDPRVEITDSDLRMQYESSMTCYEAYNELLLIREAMETKLGKLKGKRQSDAIKTLRGSQLPGNPDILYGSIRETENETLMGLQFKYLWIMNLLQNSDTKPTKQALEGIDRLNQIKTELVERWNKLK